jgi:hypothetical protein
MSYHSTTAVLYGRFIEAAYEMYGKDPANLRPAQPADFAAGYKLTAWVQMQDFFIFGSTGPTFYGFIAHSETDPKQAILAIRGTDDGLEWWDNISSIGMEPFIVPNCGNVGMGWENIYLTLELVPVPVAGQPAASLKPVGRFSAQVTEHLRRHAASAAGSSANTTPHAIAITGHSLGGALATLCAAENAMLYKKEISVQALYTFASPKVGDSGFVAAFNALDLNSWRIVNQQDIVPVLPPGFYEHVNALRQYSSQGKVQQNVGCWHAIATYLSLIDSTLKPDPSCQLPAPAAAGAV